MTTVGGAADRERTGLAAAEPSSGDWIFASGARLASRRSELLAPPGQVARPTAPAVPKAQVEPELAHLVRAGAPTRRVLCRLAARAVEIRSGSQLGFARTHDLARERHGISARWLQELAQVDRVLTQAPALEAAFQAGRLGWTALRSLARLERIEDEALWIRRAMALPLPELERAVRAARRPAELAQGVPPEPDPEETDACIPVPCTRRVRAKWSLGRELARRVAGGRLPRWECAEVVAAEASSAAPPRAAGWCDLDEALQPGVCLGDLVGRRQAPGGHWDAVKAAKAELTEPGAGSSFARRADGEGEGPIPVSGDGGEERSPRSPAGATGPEPPPSASLHPSLPALPAGLARLLAGLEHADAFEVDRRLRRALERERTFEARIGPLLRRVLEERLYRRRGYWDRDRYLEERLGMCPRKARALVRIERVLAGAPALARAYRSGSLSWVQTQALAPLFEIGVAGRYASAWVDRAASVTVRRLQDDVREALALADLDAERFARTGGLPGECADPTDPEEVEMEERKTGARSDPEADGRAERQTRAHTEPAPESREDVTISFYAPSESARFFRAVLEEVRDRLARARGAPVSEGEAFEAMLDHAIHTWSDQDAKARREHRVFERDGWRCAVPGCTSHRNLQAHHIVFRSHGGGDELENLVTLCAWHHQRGVHGGRVRITGRAPDRLRFELGLRDGESPLMVYESGDRLIR